MSVSVKTVVWYIPHNATAIWAGAAFKAKLAVERDLMCKFLQTAPLIPSYPARRSASLKALKLTRACYFPCQPFLCTTRHLAVTTALVCVKQKGSALKLSVLPWHYSSSALLSSPSPSTLNVKPQNIFNILAVMAKEFQAPELLDISLCYYLGPRCYLALVIAWASEKILPLSAVVRTKASPSSQPSALIISDSTARNIISPQIKSYYYSDTNIQEFPVF